jgi:hypothetical protein
MFISALLASKLQTVCSKLEVCLCWKYCVFIYLYKSEDRVDIQHAKLNAANFQSGNKQINVCIIPIQILQKCMLTNNLNTNSG